MSELLAWALHTARQHTLALVADVPADRMCRQSIAGEHHPAWVLGHLLLSDAYLLSLLRVSALPDDFTSLLRTYGPGAVPVPSPVRYETRQVLVERLSLTGSLRVEAVRAMSAEALGRSTPDAVLSRTQPTIGHHLQALLFHEGHHDGQLSVWRARQGLAPARWTFAGT